MTDQWWDRQYFTGYFGQTDDTMNMVLRTKTTVNIVSGDYITHCKLAGAVRFRKIHDHPSACIFSGKCSGSMENGR